MGLSNKVQIKRAEEIGKVCAESLFDAMLDPKFRGPMFSWDTFGKSVSSYAKTQVLLCFPHKVKPHIEKIASDIALETFNKLVKERKPI